MNSHPKKHTYRLLWAIALWALLATLIPTRTVHAEMGNQSDVSGPAITSNTQTAGSTLSLLSTEASLFRSQSGNINSISLRNPSPVASTEMFRYFYQGPLRKEFERHSTPPSASKKRQMSYQRLLFSLESLNLTKHSPEAIRNAYQSYNDYITTLSPKELNSPPTYLVMLKHLLGTLVAPSQYPTRTLFNFLYGDSKAREKLRISLANANPDPSASIKLSELVLKLTDKSEIVSRREISQIYNNYVKNAQVATIEPELNLLRDMFNRLINETTYEHH